MTREYIVKRWIEDMCKHGFMSGWSGDRSNAFKDAQFAAMIKVLDGDVSVIGSHYRLLATIHSDYSNLKQYADWSNAMLEKMLSLFGFEKFEHVIAVMGCGSKGCNEFMENGKLKPGVKFYLHPEL
jgi:hypothetical protein